MVAWKTGELPRLICWQLSAVTSVTKVLSTVSALPIFTPALGYTYLPAAPKCVNSAINTQVNQTSKDSTPIPGTQETNRGVQILPVPKITSEADDQSVQLLAESWSLSLRYGSEYMDENPLVGEPGSFIMSKTREPAPTSSLKIQTSIPSKPADSAETKTPTPFASGRKGSKGNDKSPISPGTKDRKAKRKSKVAGAGGTTTPK